MTAANLNPWNGIERPSAKRDHARAWFDLFPTRRFPGWLALVWAAVPGHAAQVYHVYVGRDCEEVKTLATLYAMAVRAGGLEDGAT